MNTVKVVNGKSKFEGEDKVAILYNIESIPFNFLNDFNGKIVAKKNCAEMILLKK